MDTLEPHLNALAATLGLPALTLDAQGLHQALRLGDVGFAAQPGKGSQAAARLPPQGVERVRGSHGSGLVTQQGKPIAEERLPPASTGGRARALTRPPAAQASA